MEGDESILDTVFDEENYEDIEDVEMPDAEEGELIQQNSPTDLGQISSRDCNVVNQQSPNINKGCKNKKKKKNRRKRGASGANGMNMNRFVQNVCWRLREKKSYLVWTAVGCLGMSALNDLVKEVEAIQACGGQKTADGGRFRNGGGILWNILKARDPNAYREIMKKGKEFEKQFRQQYFKGAPESKKEPSSRSNTGVHAHQTTDTALDGSKLVPEMQNQLEHSNELVSDMKFERSNAERKHASAHDRLRVPVTYDDLVGDPED